METLLRQRIAASPDWLAGQVPPGLGPRRRLVEGCRAELVWARADWMEIALTAEGWQDACLPHERTAARLLAVWGHLQPLEDRLHRTVERLTARRKAGWEGQTTVTDLQSYRHERAGLWRAFLAEAADYRDGRSSLGVGVALPVLRSTHRLTLR